MRIGLDVDGVLTDLEGYQLKYGKKYFLSKNPNLKINENGYDICDIFHCSKQEREKFWTKYIWGYCMKKTVDGAAEMVARLRAEGHEVHIITGRAHTTDTGPIGNLFRKMLIRRLKKDGLEYDSIHFVSESKSAEEKVKVCQDLNIDVMIEDKKENVEALSKGIDVICFDTSYNQEIVSQNYIRVSNFEEAYQSLGELSKQKYGEPKVLDNASTKFKKDKFKFSYGIVRIIGTPLFKLLLKPTILNKNNIPKSGAVILCGNHLHVWDQFPIICSTRRTTHWMAKKEYFDGKLGPIFRATGAISVDRFGNPHESVEIAQNYLNIKSVVGLFPEGTRNHIKLEKLNDIYQNLEGIISEQSFKELLGSQNVLLSQLLLVIEMYKSNQIDQIEFLHSLKDVDNYLKMKLSEEEYFNSLLLPFKFGAVSMAQKCNATIIPFAVTGDYIIGNDNLTVNIGEGFKVNDMDLEEANEKLRQKILTLLQENKKR